jgi:hypothetical protein
VWTVLAIALVITTPFVYFDLNYFGERGLLDRFGGFSAVLTGFYIAALVGVASFSSSLGDLDEPIEVGTITRVDESGAPYDLTRRQYVCSMFGYLAFVSLVISMIAIVLVSVSNFAWSKAITGLVPWQSRRAAADGIEVGISVLMFVINMVLAHMLVTTCYGLYYLIDRLYAAKPKLLPKRPET